MKTIKYQLETRNGQGQENYINNSVLAKALDFAASNEEARRTTILTFSGVNFESTMEYYFDCAYDFVDECLNYPNGDFTKIVAEQLVANTCPFLAATQNSDSATTK
jgi:hypothetical protein